MRRLVAAMILAAMPALAHPGWGPLDAVRAPARAGPVTQPGEALAQVRRPARRSDSMPVHPIEELAVAKAMRERPWLYPAVQVVHIVGFVILVGAALMFDLRVLGLSKAVPVRAMARHLLPWSVAALLLILPTGLMMFAAHAGELLANRAFQLKMALLLAAGMNAAFFHTGPFQTVAAWDANAAAPAGARVSAAASMAIWIAVIACGRLLAYV